MPARAVDGICLRWRSARAAMAGTPERKPGPRKARSSPRLHRGAALPRAGPNDHALESPNSRRETRGATAVIPLVVASQTGRRGPLSHAVGLRAQMNADTVPRLDVGTRLCIECEIGVGFRGVFHTRCKNGDPTPAPSGWRSAPHARD